MKNNSKILIYKAMLTGLLFMMLCSCKDNINSLNTQETGSFTDPRDGKVYKTVKIGDHWIMAENFAYKPVKGNYWAYNFDTSNVAKYGYLYDWEIAKIIAPAGWHLPSGEEWMTLRKSLGGKLELWPYMEKVYKQLVVGGGSGFNALFGGECACNGKFMYRGEQAAFWSSTNTSDGISIYGLDSNKDSIPHGLTGRKGAFAYRNGYGRACSGYSVRLFKD